MDCSTCPALTFKQWLHHETDFTHGLPSCHQPQPRSMPVSSHLLARPEPTGPVLKAHRGPAACHGGDFGVGVQDINLLPVAMPRSYGRIACDCKGLNFVVQVVLCSLLVLQARTLCISN